MTLKNSFSKLLIQNTKRRISCAALSILLLFFALPVFGAVSISRYMDRLANNYTTIPDIITSYRFQIVGNTNAFLNTITIILAIIIALNGFSYLFSRQKTDLYHSAPIKRTTLFAVRFVNGIIYYAVPYLFMLIISLLIGKVYGIVDHITLCMALTTYFMNVAGFLLLYSITILAIMLTGNLMVALMATGVFLLYGPCCGGIAMGYFGSFFKTYYSNGPQNALYMTPVYYYFKGLNSIGNRFTDVIRFPLTGLLSVLIAAAVLIGISIVLYRHRPSEAAGKSMVYPITMPIVQVLLLVPLSLFGGLAFFDIISLQKDGWLIFGLIVGLLLSHVVIQIIYYLDYKAVFKNKRYVILSAVLVAIIVCIFRFDLTGYDSYLPSEAELDHTAISSYSLQGYLDYYDFNTMPYYDPDEMQYRNNSYYIDANDYRFNHMTLTDNKQVLEFARICVEDTLAKKADKSALSTKSDYMDYDANYEGNISINFKYTLKNGKAVMRSYNVNLNDCLDTYNAIYCSDEYKNSVFPILSIPDDEIKNFYYSSPLGIQEMKQITTDQLKELITTYQKELHNQNAFDMLNEIPLGYICSRKSVKDENGYNNIYDCYQGYIYPSFTQTRELLKQYGIVEDDYSNISNISHITVTNYHYEDDAYFTQEEKEYTDEATIRQIMENSIPAEFAGVDSMLRPIENLDVVVYYKNVTNDFANSCSFYIRKGAVPAQVAKDVNYVSSVQ